MRIKHNVEFPEAFAPKEEKMTEAEITQAVQQALAGKD